MIRYYCDVCKQEMISYLFVEEGMNGGRLAAKIERNGVSLAVEVIHTKDGVSNQGDVCKYCILDALFAADDRPKPKDRTDIYSELGEALGSDPMDSHEGRLRMAREARACVLKARA